MIGEGLYKYLYNKCYPIQKNNKQIRMYVLVRQDLAETYRMVQGTHAVAAYALDGIRELNLIRKTGTGSSPAASLFNTWNNEYLICLGVPNLISLKDWCDKLIHSGKMYKSFYEPDLDNQITAIACIDTGEIFSKLPLAR
jgi:hypothetical protein